MSSKKEGQDKPRGRYGDGSIYERKDGRFEGSCYVEGKRKSVYGKSRSEVRKKLKEVQRKAEQGEMVAASRVTVEGYMNQWFEVHKLEIKESTAQQYGYIVSAHIIPALGHLQVQKLRVDQMQKFITGLLDADLAPSTIRNIMMVLNMALDHAVQRKVIVLNPCTAVTLPRMGEQEKQVLSAEQAQLLMMMAKDTILECLVTVALATGMRCGELLGLKWSDIDWEAGRVTVARTLVYINTRGFYLTEPKTKRGKRTIPLAGFALEALKEHRRKQREARLGTLAWKYPEMVFARRNGDYMPYKTIQWHFDRLVAQDDFPQITFHSLRHSAATLLLSMGVPAHVVQQILGHSQIATTLGIYGHVLSGQKEQAIDKLDGLFSEQNFEPKREVQ